MAGVRHVLLTGLACSCCWDPCLIFLAAQTLSPQLHVMLGALQSVTSCISTQDNCRPTLLQKKYQFIDLANITLPLACIHRSC